MTNLTAPAACTQLPSLVQNFAVAEDALEVASKSAPPQDATHQAFYSSIRDGYENAKQDLIDKANKCEQELGLLDDKSKASVKKFLQKEIAEKGPAKAWLEWHPQNPTQPTPLVELARAVPVSILQRLTAQ